MKKFEKTESERRLPLRLHNSSPSLLWGVISFVQKVVTPLKWNRQKVRYRATFDRLTGTKSAAAPRCEIRAGIFNSHNCICVR
jgi:hypothetical protein